MIDKYINMDLLFFVGVSGILINFVKKSKLCNESLIWCITVLWFLMCLPLFNDKLRWVIFAHFVSNLWSAFPPA